MLLSARRPFGRLRSHFCPANSHFTSRHRFRSLLPRSFAASSLFPLLSLRRPLGFIIAAVVAGADSGCRIRHSGLLPQRRVRSRVTCSFVLFCFPTALCMRLLLRFLLLPLMVVLPLQLLLLLHAKLVLVVFLFFVCHPQR